MTDRDEDMGQEAAPKGKGKAGGQRNGDQARPRAEGKGADGDRPHGRGRGQNQGQGQNQNQNQRQNRNRDADHQTGQPSAQPSVQPSVQPTAQPSGQAPDQAAGADKLQGQSQNKGKNRNKDQDQVPAKTPAPAEDASAEGKDQARNARRSANQRAREAARAERQAERARRKQDRAQTKDAEIAGKNRTSLSITDDYEDEAPADRDRKAHKKPGQGKKDRNASPQPVGFVPFAPPPDAPVSAPAPTVVFDTPPEDVESAPFNILLIGQSGALARQAVIFAASLRMFSPKWRGRLIVAEPQPDGAWSGASTRIDPAERELLQGYGAEILPFTARHFGRDYPFGNKIEALALLPAGEPFVFFDSDTIITGPLGRCEIDFSRPTASMRREGSWPEPPLYGPGYADIWRSLYDRFGLDFESSLDPDQPDEHWERYLYFNAGWFLGNDPVAFGTRFLDWALAVRNDPGEALASQSLDPWLDQAVLPLVVHALGGGRPEAGLDGFDNGVTCHYRNLSLLYAREPDSALAAMEQVLALPELRELLGQDAACERLVYQRGGRDLIRPIFSGKPLPSKEKAIRQELKKQGLWFGR